jgi:hypothetical protein
MMSKACVLPDLPARRRALLDHSTTLLVEAGAGSGKTALMAGRVALLLAAGFPTREIVAITFTEAAASELRERIEGFVNRLARADIPDELRVALPDGLSAEQSKAIAAADETLDELTCTTIHGFCQQLVKPYPVEARIDPGATIIDPEAADLAYQDLVQAWLSARFGRDRGTEGLGRLPPLPALGEQDFFAELLVDEHFRYSSPNSNPSQNCTPTISGRQRFWTSTTCFITRAICWPAMSMCDRP